MRERPEYQLQEGTILDDRYIVGDVLGEGGFGITYAATNTHNGLRVAIKEFFLRSAMTRNTASSTAVRGRTEADEPSIVSEKKRFLKEARALGDFSGMPGIVQIVDNFEGNGTAYIVMELLDGETLKEHLKTNVRMSDDAMFRKFIPVIQTLAKIHGTGLIHRDISPDNIMLRPDGSLTLMDFGAARKFSEEERSHTMIYKDHYSAREQFDRHGKLGPWTDVYSLCATMYACITWSAPDDAVQRVLLDEVKRPSELGISMRKGAEAILMRGLALTPEKRWQSMDELLAAILELYPEADPARAQERRRKKRRLAFLTGLAAALILFFGVRYYLVHQVEIRFRRIETETTWLHREEETPAEDFAQMKAAAKRRVEAFAGKNNYIWREDGDSVEYTVPLELYGGFDPLAVTRAYISRPLVLWFVSGDSKIRVPAERGDLLSLEKKWGTVPYAPAGRYRFAEGEEYFYFELSLSEAVAGELAPDLGTEGALLYLAFDVGTMENNFYEWTLYAKGDGRTAYLVDNEIQGRIGGLLEYDLTSEPLSGIFSSRTEWRVKWENPATSPIAGQLQCSEDALDGETLLLEYSTGAKSSGDWYSEIAVFKSRLDAVGLPYAFGISELDERTIIIKTNAASLWQAEIDTLGRYTNLHLFGNWGEIEMVHSVTGFSSSSVSGEEKTELEILRGEGGDAALRVNLRDSYIDSTREKLEQLRAEGETKLYLSMDSVSRYFVASADLGDAIAEAEGGTITFPELLVGDSGCADAENHFLDYICACNLEKPASAVNVSAYLHLLSDGTPDFYYEGAENGFYEACMEEYREIADELEQMEMAAEGPLANCTAEAVLRETNGTLAVYIRGLAAEGWPLDGYEAVKALYERFSLSQSSFTYIAMYLNREETEAGEGGSLFQLWFLRNAEKRDFVCDINISEYTEAQWEEVGAYLEGDEFYAAHTA